MTGGGEEEEGGAAGAKEAMALLVPLRPEEEENQDFTKALMLTNHSAAAVDSRRHVGGWPLHFRVSWHTLVRGPINSYSGLHRKWTSCPTPNTLPSLRP